MKDTKVARRFAALMTALLMVFTMVMGGFDGPLVAEAKSIPKSAILTSSAFYLDGDTIISQDGEWIVFYVKSEGYDTKKQAYDNAAAALEEAIDKQANQEAIDSLQSAKQEAERALDELKMRFRAASGLVTLAEDDEYWTVTITDSSEQDGPSINFNLSKGDEYDFALVNMGGGGTFDDPAVFTMGPVPKHWVLDPGLQVIVFDTAWDDEEARQFYQYNDGNAVASNCLPKAGGSYYLTDDVTLSGTWVVNDHIGIDLAGYDIIADGNFDAIQVGDGKTLSIYDSTGNNGTIKHTSEKTGAAVVLGVHVENEDYNAEVAAIVGDDYPYEQYFDSQFYFFSGNITENIVSEKSVITADKTGSKVAIYGGKIYGNVCTESSYAVYIGENAKCVLGDKPYVTGNTDGEEEEAANRNLYLAGEVKISFDFALKDGARVDISMENPGDFTSGYAAFHTVKGEEPGDETITPPGSFFKSDSSTYTVALNDNDDKNEAQLKEDENSGDPVQSTSYNVTFDWNYTGAGDAAVSSVICRRTRVRADGKHSAA